MTAPRDPDAFEPVRAGEALSVCPGCHAIVCEVDQARHRRWHQWLAIVAEAAEIRVQFHREQGCTIPTTAETL